MLSKEEYNKYNPDKCIGTSILINQVSAAKNSCSYWLRDSAYKHVTGPYIGDFAVYTASIVDNSKIEDEIEIDTKNIAVRPAMWISIE